MLPSGMNLVTLCGLIPGKMYRIIGVDSNTNNTSIINLYMAAEINMGNASKYLRTDMPQMREFVAQESCIDIIYELNNLDKNSLFPVYLSSGCLDCQSDSFWINRFKENATYALSKLQTTGGVSASTLINDNFAGNNISISNITSLGPQHSRGTFTNGSSSIDIEEGIVLCTGNLVLLPGPNDTTNISGNTAGFNVNTSDDADIAKITNGNQFDVVRIEFDFKPQGSVVKFDFVFGSEEYCEYANSQYNDAFGIFISSPGSDKTNLALVPGTNIPIAVNNINHLDNSQYYINNNNWNPCTNLPIKAYLDCELDGWTTVFTATYNTIPNNLYHIKFVIADIADGLLASAVFLKAKSFNSLTSINEKNRISNISLIGIPNPTMTSQTTLQFNLDYDCDVRFRIYNTQGKIVSECSQFYSTGKHEKNIYLESSGVYIVEVLTPYGYGTKKLIKI